MTTSCPAGREVHLRSSLNAHQTFHGGGVVGLGVNLENYQGGYLLFFAYILANRAGVPLPATPALLGAGALAGLGEFHFAAVFALGVTATLASDSGWFYLGRRYGHRLLNLLCRFALDPETCTKHTHDFLLRHGVRSLLVTKFLPGMNRTVLPLTGTARTPFLRFLAWDAAGSALWVAVYAGLGFLFSEQIHQAAESFIRIAGYAGVGLVVAAVIGYMALKTYQRRRVLKEVVERITADELHTRVRGGERLAILDLRDRSEWAPDHRRIPGAVMVHAGEVEDYCQSLPPGLELVLYCT